MNANELLAAMDGATVNILQSPEANALVLRALSLLAAAEANDGTTPETDNPSNIDTWRAVKDTSRRLERERNGLAAEVGRLRSLLPDDYARADMEAREP